MSDFTHEVPGGAAWSFPIRAGRLVTLTALGDDACVSTLLFGPDRLDRLNVPDTLKAQMSACIKAPMVLMSDRGVALASVVSSSLDWHDCLTGFGSDAHLARFGPSSYAVDRNDWKRSARTGLVSELTKHGLGEADLHGSVNFFSKVGITDDPHGTLGLLTGVSHEGDTVTLRTEVDVLLVLATAPHPLSTTPYAPAGVRIDVAIAEPVTSDDPSWQFRDESARALEQARRLAA
ncbi:DUF1989 domain-containing protein [Nocardioides sp. WS12]|uniref:DUF1989 domain-containing protein n=1 Tax=Nocardioides sp. WS12 TaxID=2486272 RepID=UPI0015FB6BD3|nr:DUF1989 domain-containing protein [Nocardioides sp. WS12]